MAVIDRKSVLSGLTVRDAMRKLVVHLFKDSTIEQSIRYTIKYKLNAVLIANEKNEAVGVVSKTNLMGAYYAGLPTNTPLESIMMSPVLLCEPNDSLAYALDGMRTHRIHRLYVSGGAPNQAIGVLAYPDILGLLYRYCHKCPRSTLRPKQEDAGGTVSDHFKVCEIMTRSVHSHNKNDEIFQVMEKLATYRSRAVLIRGRNDLPVGVVSLTDLIIAYLHGVPSNAEAKSIMSSPVRSCDQNDPLVMAIQKLIFADLQSLYVHKDEPKNIVGVISLGDIARVRSGSCRACMTSRIDIESPP